MAIGYLQINGSGPKNAAVGVFDLDDNLVAETRSDARGFWSIASVPMEAGAYQLRAKMRAENGYEHISNVIDISVDDPDADVEIEATALDPVDVAVMEEIEAERLERASLSAAFDVYDQLVAQGVAGSDINDGHLHQVLNVTGGTRDSFYADVSEKRQKAKYIRIVCAAAAGVELDDRDKRSIWSDFRKTEEEFASSVSRARYSASVGWDESLEN